MKPFEMLWEEIMNVESSFDLNSSESRYLEFKEIIIPRTKRYTYEHPCYDKKNEVFFKKEVYFIDETRLLFSEARDFKLITGDKILIKLESFDSIYEFELDEYDIFDIYVWFELFRLPKMFLSEVAEKYYYDEYVFDSKNDKEKLITETRSKQTAVKSKSKTYIMKDANTNLYKIGKSINPKHRERTLQCEKPTIKMVKIFESDIEKQLHEIYSKNRVRGEWFNLNEIQLRYICTHYN